MTIASLSALEKGTDEDGETEVRVLHDGTHGVDTNKYIKVLDGGLSPIARDLKTSMRMQAARGTPHCGVTVDVEGAHKVIVVRPEDWPLQACQIVPGGDVFLNTRGTFGIASAAYWWGRLAAALSRAGLLVPWLPLWAFLFADDYDLTAEGKEFMMSILAFVLWLDVLGVPLSWKKSRGGLTYTWVGYEKSLREWTLGISEQRAAWVDRWLTKVLDARRVHTGELREALGRMVYVYGALNYDRPFLGPLFAFLSVHPAGVSRRLPVYALVVVRWLRDQIRRRRSHVVRRRGSIEKAVLRVDAKAEGLVVAVGGGLHTITRTAPSIPPGRLGSTFA